MWFILAACSGDPGPPGTPDDAPPPAETGAPFEPSTCPPFAVTVGTGATAYQPLPEGADLVIVHGFQGLNAFHLDVAGRVTGGGGSVAVTATVTRQATGEVVVHAGQLSSSGTFPLAPLDACTADFYGHRAIFDTAFPWVTSAGVCALDGETFRLALDVTDLASGATASSAVEVVVHPMPLDPDYDGWSWDCDNCPVDANPDQADADADGTGDACEPTRP